MAHLLKRLTQRLGTDLRLVIVAATVTVVALAALYLVGRHALDDNHVAVTHSKDIELTPTVLENIRNTGQWVVLEVADEELADTVRHGFFGDDELARVYYGTLRLGFDMRQCEEGWIQMDGDTVVVTLPPIGLVDTNFLDEARSQPFYESGRWSEADRAALARQAARQMRRRCLTESNLRQARHNAAMQFTAMLNAMGFEYVRVKQPEAAAP